MSTGAVILLIVAAIVVLAIVALASTRRERPPSRAAPRARPTATAATRVCTRRAPSANRRAPRSRPRAHAGRPPRPKSARSARRWNASAPRTTTSARATSTRMSTRMRKQRRRRVGKRHAVAHDSHLTGVAWARPAGRASAVNRVAHERYEPDRLEVRPLQRLPAAVDQQQALFAAVDGRHQPAAVGQLLLQRARHLVRCGGHVDGFERGLLGQPAAAVADHDVHVLDSRGGEVVPRLLGQLRPCARCSTPRAPGEPAPPRDTRIRCRRRGPSRRRTARAPRTCARPRSAARSSAPRRSGAQCSPTRSGTRRRGRTGAAGPPQRPPAPVRPRCTVGASL